MDTQLETAQRTAEKVAEAMITGDKVAVWLGAELLNVAPGSVTLRMTIREDMLNVVNIGHGGVTFSLADVAFAMACNSHNNAMVAQTCSISFLGPVNLGDVLTATVDETLYENRSGIYDIKVTNQRDETIAVFRGQSRAIPGQIISNT